MENTGGGRERVVGASEKRPEMVFGAMETMPTGAQIEQMTGAEQRATEEPIVGLPPEMPKAMGGTEFGMRDNDDLGMSKNAEQVSTAMQDETKKALRIKNPHGRLSAVDDLRWIYVGETFDRGFAAKGEMDKAA